EVERQVGRRSRVGLDIGVVDAEQRLRPFDGELLNLVDDLLTLVVAPAGITLGVLIGQYGSGRFKNGPGDVVLARDQADFLCLPATLRVDQPGDLRVVLGKAGKEA